MSTTEGVLVMLGLWLALGIGYWEGLKEGYNRATDPRSWWKVFSTSGEERD